MDIDEMSCQSCGMPLAMDPNIGGTEADGSKTTEYCSYCYVNGAFTQPDLTAQAMIVRVRSKLLEKNIPPSAITVVTEDIPLLRRWRTGVSSVRRI